MKIGILTFHFAINYGAALQAYALKNYLLKCGHNASIINYRPRCMRSTWDLDAYLSSLGCLLNKNNLSIRSIISWAHGIYRQAFFRLFKYKHLKKKYDIFNKFSENYLTEGSSLYQDYDELKTLKEYDILICGSDQIWNPEITNGLDKSYFGAISGNHAKKISYAASVGDLTIISNNNDYKDTFLGLVKNMDFVSVREKNLYNYLTSNGINAQHVVDPTFLLKKEDYERIIDNLQKQKDYVFVYYLRHDDTIDELAKKICAKNSKSNITVSGTQNYIKGTTIDLTPFDFLSYIYYSDVVITNSFHGTALSIILNKPFYVILPASRKERIYSLLEHFDLCDRIVNSATDNLKCGEINYSVINQKLNSFRQSSMQFLSNAFIAK